MLVWIALAAVALAFIATVVINVKRGKNFMRLAGQLEECQNDLTACRADHSESFALRAAHEQLGVGLYINARGLNGEPVKVFARRKAVYNRNKDSQPPWIVTIDGLYSVPGETRTERYEDIYLSKNGDGVLLKLKPPGSHSRDHIFPDVNWVTCRLVTM